MFKGATIAIRAASKSGGIRIKVLFPLYRSMCDDRSLWVRI